jgi:hypothetical protein
MLQHWKDISYEHAKGTNISSHHEDVTPRSLLHLYQGF